MNKENFYVVIMAGGIGSRFWPESRVQRPKQFLDILGLGKSLIRMTFERFLPLIPAERIYVVTHDDYRKQVKEHLPELSESQILCEPSRRNTGPCVAFAMRVIQAKNPDAFFVSAPADHIIMKETKFLQILEEAFETAERSDSLVTLGIQPTRPDTGYGYINYDSNSNGSAKPVLQFTEKPNLEKAQAFLDAGTFLWNAGIFIWGVKTLERNFREHAPEVISCFPSLASHVTGYTDEEIESIYTDVPSISVDYAILEKSKDVLTIPSQFGWSDLGTWASLHAEAEKDLYQNAILGDPIKLIDTKNCIVRIPKNKLAVVNGLEDYIVIDNDNVLLIFPKSQEQEIKTLTSELKESGATQYV